MDLDLYKKLAFKNNTFEIKAVEKSLEDSKMNAYQYLRQFQLDSTGYKRFDFNMQDIYRTNKVNHVWSFVPRRWLFFIDYEFINVGKRNEYRTSEFYEKSLDYETIINNPKLFDSSVLVFIDGQLFTEGVEVLCKEDKTFITFVCKEKPVDKGFKIKDMLYYLENNSKVTIFFVPNLGITNVHTNAYRVRSNSNYKGLPYRIMNLSENASYDENTLTYIKFNNEEMSIPVNIEFGENGLFVDENVIDEVIKNNPKDTSMNIQLIPLRNLFKKVKIEQGHKWFKLPMQDYPIATDNCLIFDNDGNFIHDANVKHYYPNVYSIENIDDIIKEKELFVYVFYYFNKQSVLKHINIVEVYQKYMYDYLERYEQGLIPDILVNYEPPVVDYSIKDFQNFNSYDSHFVYKVEKLKEFIRADVNNFRRYLRKLHVHNNYYYVDISKINLEERIKRDNSDTKLAYKEFEEDMYMFVFRNDFRSMYDKLLIHIDGLRFETIYVYGTEKFDFVYIPCRLIKEDSVLEIEKLTEVMKTFPFTAKDDIFTFDISEFAVRNKTLYNDLFLTDKETSKYIDPSQYRIIFPFDVDFNPEIIHYIKSEKRGVYYYLEVTDDSVKLVRPNRISPYYEAGYLRTEDSVNGGVYQLNIDDKDVTYDLLEGDYQITKHIESIDDPNTRFVFRIEDGKVKVDIITDENEVKTINEDDVLPDVIELSTVFLRCFRFVKLLILDESLYGKQLELNIKKNFKIAQTDTNIQNGDFMEPLDFTADMKNDPRYVRVYKNGRLLPRHIGTVRFPMDCNVGEMTVYPGTYRDEDDIISVELMPYMMHQICYLEEIPINNIIDLEGLIDKPFDFRWHDIYINGRKLVKKDVEIITANKIKLLKSNSLRSLEIIENSRDKEYFGYKPVYDFMDELFDIDEEFRRRVIESIKDLTDDEEPVVEGIITILDSLLREFYRKYMIPNYGLINPDLLQIDAYTIEYYKPLTNKDDECFYLNPDIGVGKITLPVNPDME